MVNLVSLLAICLIQFVA